MPIESRAAKARAEAETAEKKEAARAKEKAEKEEREHKRRLELEKEAKFKETSDSFVRLIRTKGGLEKARTFEYERLKGLAVDKQKEKIYDEAVLFFDEACDFILIQKGEYGWGQSEAEKERQLKKDFRIAEGKPALADGEVDPIDPRIGMYVFCKTTAAHCFMMADMYKECVSYCTDALKKDPENIRALYRRGMAYAAMGKRDEANVDFEKGRCHYLL